MYGLEDVRRFAFDWQKPHLAGLAARPAVHWRQALQTIAYTNWRWMARPLRDLLLDFEYTDSPSLIEVMLQALFGVDPRPAVDAAVEMAHQPREPWRSIGRLFLAGLPARYGEHLDSQDIEQQLCEQWLPRARGFDDRVLQIALGDLPVRVAAISRLGAVEGPEASELLRACLTNDSCQVLQKTLELIGKRDPDSALTVAEQALPQCSGLSQQAVADFLAQCGPLGIESLLVNSSDNFEWVVAGRALVHHAPAQAMDVFEEWSRSTNDEQRMVAVEVLYELVAAELRWPSADTAERLAGAQAIGIGLLGDPYEYARSAALVLLAELGWSSWQARAVAALEDRSEAVRLTAVDLLDEKDAAAHHAHIHLALADVSQCVRQRAFLHLQRRPADVPTQEALFQIVLSCPQADIRRDAVEMIARLAWQEGYALLSGLGSDEDLEVRAAVLSAGAMLAPDRQDWLREVRRACKDPAALLCGTALKLLADHGHETDLPRAARRLSDADPGVRLSALEAVCRLAPARSDEFATPALGDPDATVASGALAILSRNHAPAELAAIALAQIPHGQGEFGAELLDQVVKEATELKTAAITRGLKCGNGATRLRAATLLAADATEADAGRFQKLLRDPREDVRIVAIRALAQLGPEGRWKVAAAIRQDPEWRARLEAIWALANRSDPELLEPLLSAARDADSNVRELAIRALARFDDVRVLPELISSLSDVHPQVADVARSILSGDEGPVPVLARFDEPGRERVWQRVQARVAAVNGWAAQIGSELLGKSVIVQNCRQGLGQTWGSRAKRPVTIEVSDTPVTSGHPHGTEIMRGLALHELGHHLYDIGQRGVRAIRGIARSEGIGDIFAILLDERLERRLRARRPEWGVYFDRLSSYAFAQNLSRLALPEYARVVRRTVDETRRAVRAGRLPGQLVISAAPPGAEQVLLRDHEMLAIDGLVPLPTAFLACLRCGFDPRMHPNPKVGRAVGLVPSNLKDLAHRDMLALARRIGKVIGKFGDAERKKFRRRLARHGEMPRALREAIGRLIETGQMPGIAPDGAPGIRVTIPGQPNRPRRQPTKPSLRGLNLGPETDFEPLPYETHLPFDPAAHAALVRPIRKHIRRLRGYFERLGTKNVEEFASVRGRRLDLAQIRKLPLGGRPGILVFGREEIAADAYLGVLVDRSGSMAGENLQRAKTFCALLAESAQNLPGVEGHVSAFDDDTFYRLGDFRRTSIASLEARGGNNDSGALAKAAELALASGKREKLLIMTSDGSPTGCTFESLKELVARLERQHGIRCAQVAVQSLDQIAFPHFVDLSRYSLEEAVVRFGKMLIQLTAAWR